MSARPAPVVIDDLADPRFPLEIELLRAGLVDMAPSCPIEPDALCAAAVEQTGLVDFGDGAFRTRLDVLCSALHDEAGLAPSGIVSWLMVHHPRGRHGTVVYQPEQVGIDRAERHAALASYIEQFGVEREEHHA